jgi:hypothetical protein
MGVGSLKQPGTSCCRVGESELCCDLPSSSTQASSMRRGHLASLVFDFEPGHSIMDGDGN